ncbi:MAG TPA: cell division protein FtsA [Chloroflexota bacterium]|jgi:cell division protein FtsA|nr:cell division protein FtsA [Chloroflexota bacterium]
MPREHAVVALDVGTTKVTTLIGEIEPDRAINIVGVGNAPSRGMRKGVVVNIDEVATSIAESVDQCVRISGYRVGAAVVGVTGAHIEGLNTKGVIAISSNAQEITEDDVERAMEAARVQAISADREVLHVIPRGYTLDGQEGVRDPIGMSGHRLEAQIHIVTAATTAVHNLVRAVRRAGVDIQALVLQPLAAAEAVLVPAERDVGVALVDIGGGTTDIAIFQDLGVAYTATLPVGGFHITNDLALGLRAPVSLADEVKIQYGSAVASEFDVDDVVELKTYDNEEGEPVARRLIAEIIESRMQEIFALVKRDIDRAGFGRLLPAGVVLTGGTADLRDIRRLGRDVLGMPVRVGRPTGVVGLTDTVTKPANAASVGLLMWARKGDAQPVSVTPRAPQSQWRPEGSRITRWLREFLP